eukprot:9284663-Ditylum_brightwellii.AAC.1
MVFDQHPETWRKHYIRSRKAIQADSLAEIIQFISNKKGFADGEEEKKRKQQNGDGGGTRWFI